MSTLNIPTPVARYTSRRAVHFYTNPTEMTIRGTLEGGLQSILMKPQRPKTFKERAHALVDSLPDDSTWLALIERIIAETDRESGTDSETLVYLEEPSRLH